MLGDQSKDRPSVNAERLERGMQPAGAFLYPRRQQFLWDQLFMATLIDALARLLLLGGSFGVFPSVGLVNFVLVRLKMFATARHA